MRCEACCARWQWQKRHRVQVASAPVDDWIDAVHSNMARIELFPDVVARHALAYHTSYSPPRKHLAEPSLYAVRLAKFTSIDLAYGRIRPQALIMKGPYTTPLFSSSFWNGWRWTCLRWCIVTTQSAAGPRAPGAIIPTSIAACCPAVKAFVRTYAGRRRG